MATDVLEVILPFRVPRHLVPPATSYRSTWLLSSLGALRDRGHETGYFQCLDPAHHEAIRGLVAGVWIPVALARLHYEACDRLNLPLAEQVALGGAVSARAQGTMLGTAVRMAKVAGVTPWTILPQYDRLFHRGVEGGALAVFKLGPKEARIEIVQCELFAVPYFRTGFRGVLQGMAGLFCRTSYIHDLPTPTPNEAAFRFQWA